MTFAGECQIRVTFIANFTPCSNWGNWQYQAGVGNDPRSFRQFNQIKQANDYDADAKYILTWIPELRQVDRRFAHTPWRKSHKIQAGFVLTRFLQCYHPRRRGSIVWASKADTLRRLCLNSLNGRNTTPKKKAHMDHAQAAVMPRRTMRGSKARDLKEPCSFSVVQHDITGNIAHHDMVAPGSLQSRVDVFYSTAGQSFSAFTIFELKGKASPGSNVRITRTTCKGTQRYQNCISVHIIT